MVTARIKHPETQYEGIRIIDIDEWLEPYIGRVGKRQIIYDWQFLYGLLYLRRMLVKLFHYL